MDPSPSIPSPSRLAWFDPATRLGRLIRVRGLAPGRHRLPRAVRLGLAALLGGAVAVPLLLPLSGLVSIPGRETSKPARVFRVEPPPAAIPWGDRKLAERAVLTEPGSLARTMPTAGIPPGDGAGGAWGRRIVRQAMLEIELADVDGAVARLAEAVEAAGGFVAGTEVQTDRTGTLRATVTAYVPPARFGHALAGLDALGRVTLRRIAGQDVSEEFVDLEARMRNFERHEAQLVSFMSRAEKVSDLVSLETELARVRGEIERLAGRLRFLRGRTEMATIQVALVRAPGVPLPDESLARVWERIGAGFREGWLVALRALVGVAVVMAQLSPLAALGAAAWIAWRRFARPRGVATPPAVSAAS